MEIILLIFFGTSSQVVEETFQIERQKPKRKTPNIPKKREIKRETRQNLEEPSSEISEDKNAIKTPPSQKRVELLGKPFLFHFDERVLRWQNHPYGFPLIENNFPEYAEASLSYQKKMHLFHFPHPLVDRFISMGIQGEWINKVKKESDIRYCIPMEIGFEGKTYRGIMVYVIDERTQTCYHQFFNEKVEKEIISSIVSRKFDENDFPTLRQAEILTHIKTENLYDSPSGTVEEDPVFGNITIKDSERGITIKIFKTQE